MTSRWRLLLKSTIAALVLSNLGNFVNYVIQIVLGRHLTAEDYGTFNSVCGLGVILGSASQIIPIVMSKFVAEFGAKNRNVVPLIASWRRGVVLWGLVFVVIISLFTPLLSNYLNIQSSIPLLIFVLNIYFYHLLSLYTGVLYGLGEYSTANLLGFLHTLFRLALTWIAVAKLGYSYNAALVIWGAANIVIWLWKQKVAMSIIETRRTENGFLVETDRADFRKTLTFLIPSALTWFAIGVMTNIDLVLVKHYSAADIAGHYSLAAILSRIAFFLPQALATMILPEVSRRTGTDHKPVLLGVGVGALIAAGFALITWFFPEQIMGLLFGSSKGLGSEYLPMIAVAMALTSIVNLLASGMLAQGLYGFLVPTYVTLCGFYIYVISRPEVTPFTITSGLAASAAVILLVMVAQYRKSMRYLQAETAT